MTSINAMFPSKYLKKEDLPEPKAVTIKGFSSAEMDGDNGEKENVVIIHFNEFDKGMVLNKTNKNLMVVLLGTDQIEDMIGKQIGLHNDVTVSFGGKIIGGLRFMALASPPPVASAPQTAQAGVQAMRDAAQGQPPAPEAGDPGIDPDDQIPF